MERIYSLLHGIFIQWVVHMFLYYDEPQKWQDPAEEDSIL